MSSKGKIVKSENLRHADRILAQVRKIWPKEWEGWLKCWANGREQGYWLQATVIGDKEYARACCVFSEGRSCDGALIIPGRAEDFDYQTNQPNDKAWEGRRYFYDTDDITKLWKPDLKGRGDKKAAKWLIKRLRELLKEDREEQRELRKKIAEKKQSA
jgi:hypothetical protein